MAVDANSYFLTNPDVAAAYQENTYGMSPADFAEAHWLMYGQNEQRDAPDTLDPYYNSNPDVADAFGENRYDMNPDDFASAHYLLWGGDEQRAAPEALDPYYVNNPDVADAFKENRYGLNPTDFASVHFDRYGQDEQRAAPQEYNKAALPSFEKSFGPKPTAVATAPTETKSYLGYNPMGGSRTIGAAPQTMMGAGNANYESSLIRALREASAEPMSTNSGIKEYTPTFTPYQVSRPVRQGSSVFSPQLTGVRPATQQEISDWDAYNAYKVATIGGKPGYLSFQDWKAQSGQPASSEPVPTGYDPYGNVMYGGTVGGGN